MKTINSKISKQQAQKEIKQFLIVGYICAGIALLIFGWLSIVGIMAGARVFTLGSHKELANTKQAKQAKTWGGLLFLVSVIEFVVVLS